MVQNKKLMVYLKIAVSIGLLSILLFTIDLKSTIVNLGLIDIWLLLLVVFLRIIQFLISSVKWRDCLSIFNIDYNFGYLFKVLCVGFYLNNFFPTSIGGDSYRVYKTASDKKSITLSLSAILMDRIIGLLVLLVFGVSCGLLFIAHSNPDYISNVLKYLIYFLILIVITAVPINLGLKKILTTYLKKKKINPNIFFDQHNPFKKPASLFKIVVTSIIFHISAFVTIKILYQSMNNDISVVSSAIIVTVAVFASILPFSINGIGITETSFVAASVQVGIDYETAVVAAMTNRAITLLISLLCGIYYAYESINTKSIDENRT